MIKLLGRLLCSIGIHNYKTNKYALTYRCSRPHCHAMYMDKVIISKLLSLKLKQELFYEKLKLQVNQKKY
jgi:hypothetical protein